ncbi:formyltetrahydrofolate deformylase [Nesterenkonia muleiensis]|uniref:formyltetrahydrofolate deformylase n=1 Tax=Nesterenkonia muleiensis TaxID=2282648 RepID=UPI000E70ED2A|nr:formyltetrahydrofolate deformylase [Nesterenkonia muleiensis]
MNTEQRPDIARLIISCPDQHGIVAAVSELIAELDGNIISLDQYSTGVEGGQFFQRTVFHLPGLHQRRQEVEQRIQSHLAQRFSMEFRLSEAAQPKRVAIFASRTDHCLLDLLWRHRRGDLPMQIPLVISNHADLEEDVRRFGIDFHHIPVDRSKKSAAEKQHLDLLADSVDLIVLARYMQILSPQFLERVGVPIINIHHSFLPAFIGAGPYQKAKDRGVKLIGATAHYVTEDLDEGPIIEQDVIRVSHADDVAQLTRFGADVERAVLSRAVKWHCEDRVLRHGNTTIVF